jgi:hypothetical protein
MNTIVSPQLMLLLHLTIKRPAMRGVFGFHVWFNYALAAVTATQLLPLGMIC